MSAANYLWLLSALFIREVPAFVLTNQKIIDSSQVHATSSDAEYFDLLDETIVLHSRIDFLPDETSVEQELKELRRSEVRSLVEDIAIARSEVKEEHKLIVLGKQLDDAILEGYQSTFSEEELEIWIKRIESLQSQIEAEMKKETPESLLEIFSVENDGRNKCISSLATRLEQLRTLIAPVSYFSTQVQHTSNTSSNPLTETTGAIAVTKTDSTSKRIAVTDTKNTPSPVDTSKVPLPTSTAEVVSPPAMKYAIDADFSQVNGAADEAFSSLNGATDAFLVNAGPDAAPSKVSGTGDTTVPPADDIREEEASLVIPDAVVDSVNSTFFAPPVETITIEPTSSSTQPTSETKGTRTTAEVVEEKPIIDVIADTTSTSLEEEEIASSGEVEDNDEGDDSLVANGTEDQQEKEQTEIKAAAVVGQQPEGGIDAVSAVISAAALGAVAVTQVPYYAAGVALGPVVNKSIAYAKAKFAEMSARKKQKAEAAAKAKEEKDASLTNK